jgi:biotin carboxyl carrier protein
MGRKYRINIEGEERVVEVVEQGEKDYLITLDGTTYQTRIEEARGSGSELAQPTVTVSQTSSPASARRASEPNLPAQKPVVDAEGAIQIVAPLTGKVISVKVASGAKVERGQLLCLLEAMKMEVEVFASQSGVVTKVAVEPADTVQQGDLLIVLKAE